MSVSAITITVGAAMFVTGLVMFYSVEMGQTEPTLRFVKNAGIFIGLTGIGAAMAGVLISLMMKNEPIGR